MPFSIPITKLTGNYQLFPPAPSSLFGTGWVFVQNGNVDLQIYYGTTTGDAQAMQSVQTEPGQYIILGSQQNHFIQVGARAAAGTVLAPAQTIQGQFYDIGIPSLVPVAGGLSTASTPAFSQFSDVAAGGLANVPFHTIPQTASHLLLIFQVRSATAATSDTMNMRINQINAGHLQQTLVADTAATSAVMNSALTTSPVALVPGATSPGGDVWAHGRIIIPNYTATLQHMFVSRFYSPYNVGAAQQTSVYGGGEINGDLPVLKLDLQLLSGANYGAGSRVTLYGVT